MTINRGLLDYTPYIDRFISPSRFLANRIENAGLSARRIIHIPNFLVNMDAMTPHYENDGYFVYVGRLSYEKGLLTLLKAFEQCAGAKLCIIGDGPLKKELTDYCEEKKLGNVALLGHLEQRQIGHILSKAMAVIVPSEWHENQPMSIIEAFAHGKPVIAANIGGIPEMVIDGHNGMLFEPGNVEALVSVIRKASSSTDHLKALGQTAWQYATEHYHSAPHLKALMKVYTALAG